MTSYTTSKGRVDQVLKGASILLVEDHEAMREGLWLILESKGASVRSAASQAQALEIERGFRPDLLIVDLELPDGHGCDVVRELRARGGAKETTPALALTAHTSAADYEATREAGFAAHIAKPVDEEHLVAVIRRLLSEAAAVEHG